MQMSAAMLKYLNYCYTQKLESCDCLMKICLMNYRIICITLLMLGLNGCGKSDPNASFALPVSVMEAKASEIVPTIEAIGQTEGAKAVEVRARVGGILLERLYQEGARVEEGDKLFQIDPATFEIAKSRAEAALAAQEAKVVQTVREVERRKDLLTKHAVSQQEYDDAVLAAQVAEAGLKAAAAELREAELNLSYSTVTAPISGISGRALRSDGTLISPGPDSLLTHIVQIHPIWVRFNVAPNELAKIPFHPDKPRFGSVELLLADNTTYSSNGVVNFTASEIDLKLGTLELRAEFPNLQSTILPGQFVRVRVYAGSPQTVYLVPHTAVMQSEQGPFVYVINKEGTAEIRPLKTNGSQSNHWIVHEGLSAGDQIILDNLMKLQPGAPVTPLPPAVTEPVSPG